MTLVDQVAAATPAVDAVFCCTGDADMRRYVKIRQREFMDMLKILVPHLERTEDLAVADIGCGNGYMSALWSVIAGRVYAVDAEACDLMQHSRGLTVAREAVAQLPHGQRVEILPGGFLVLPPKTAAADIVFSCYVLEHVLPDAEALCEAAGHFGPSAVHVHIVPVFADRVLSVFENAMAQLHPVCMAKNVMRPVWHLLHGRGGDAAAACRRLATCLWPRPHDRRLTFREECHRYSRRRWRTLFERAGYRICDEGLLHRRRSVCFILRPQ